MKLVIIESPFAADTGVVGAAKEAQLKTNAAYRDLAMDDSFRRGEAPLAPHRMYPGVLDDDVPEQRQQGINAGLAWGKHAALTAVYADLGISPGMRQGIERAQLEGRTVEFRFLHQP